MPLREVHPRNAYCPITSRPSCISIDTKRPHSRNAPKVWIILTDLWMRIWVIVSLRCSGTNPPMYTKTLSLSPSSAWSMMTEETNQYFPRWQQCYYTLSTQTKDSVDMMYGSLWYHSSFQLPWGFIWFHPFICNLHPRGWPLACYLRKLLKHCTLLLFYSMY